jgi:hypothetical protein
MQPLISWDAPEHIHTEKNNDWYWSVGIITITAAVLAFIFNNIIFGILILVGSFALIIHATKKPRIVHYEINDRGVVVNNILYPFLTLDSFWINPDDQYPKVIIKSHKTFMPYISIYIEDVNPEEVRDILLNYISETEHNEPLFQKLLERFGF